MIKPKGMIGIVTKALAGSFTVKLMIGLARELIPNYDLHKRTGIHKSLAIPNINAARQIVVDMKKRNIIPHFINLLIQAQYKGIKGRKHQIKYLRELIVGIHGQGFLYDSHNKMFVEDPRIRRTRDWGVLIEGEEYNFAFLRLDIVGNSKLVKKYSKKDISKTYSDLHQIVKSCCEKRNGRFWHWEGDGGLMAFFFSNKNTLAVLSGMEIIHELFLYNKTKCTLDTPLEIRLAIHCGMCNFTNNEEDITNLDIVKETIQFESKYGKSNTVTISQKVLTTLDQRIIDFLVQKRNNQKVVYTYSL